MFKYITINLTSPICQCTTQELWWSPTTFVDNIGTRKFGFAIGCRTCQTRLDIGDEQFKAQFNFDVPYPEQKKLPAPAQDKPERKQGGTNNVVQLFTKFTKDDESA